jgi:GDP-L-fucose synthase
MIAAKVGGIGANVSDPVGFLSENISINANLFEACWRFNVKKSLFLGSSCIYPVNIDGLISESMLMSGPLEPTNEGYALSKIVGLKLASYYNRQFGMSTVCPMFCNIYGDGDSFDLNNSHVLSALVKRFVDAKRDGSSEVKLWGTGVARREFIHTSDVAKAILFFMNEVSTVEHINVGPGKDISIYELAKLIAELVGYQGFITWDGSKPDGMLRKCMDVSRLKSIGFEVEMSLVEGINKMISSYNNFQMEK